MDPINLAYYATVCALLSALSPQLRTPIWRLGIGAIVGLIAAGGLPYLKALAGI